MGKMSGTKKVIQTLLQMIFVCVFVFLISGMSANASTFTYKGKTYDTEKAEKSYYYNYSGSQLYLYQFSFGKDKLIYIVGELSENEALDYPRYVKNYFFENTKYYIYMDCKVNGWIHSDYAVGSENILGIDFGENFDVSNATSMGSFFCDCSSVESIDLSKFDTSNATKMNNMFRNCSKLKSVDLSSFNTSKVTDMGGMFGDCQSLVDLDVSGFNTSKVTRMNYMFGGCKNLKQINLSTFNTKNVEEIGGMFSGCQSLTAIDVSSFDTSKVTSFSYMFENCLKLEKLDLSSFSYAGMPYKDSKIEWLTNCISLKELIICNYEEAPLNLDNDTYWNTRLGDIPLEKLVLKNCKISWGDLPYPMMDTKTRKVYDKFEKGTYNCTLVKAYVPKAGDKIKNGTDVFIFKKNTKGSVVLAYSQSTNSNATSITIPATVKAKDGRYHKVVEIAANAFKNNSKLATITIGKNVNTIGKNAFYNNKALKTIKGAEAVTTIDASAFSGCKVLKTIPSFAKLKTIGEKAFYDCGTLTKFTIDSSVTKIGKSAFQNCKKLKTLTIKTTKLTNGNVGSNAFKSISSSATIKVPKSKYDAYKKILAKKGITGKKQKIKK